MVIVEAVSLGLELLSAVFNWIFSNMYTSILVGTGLVLTVIGIILAKVKG